MSSKIMKSIGTFAVWALFTFSFLFLLAGSLSDSGPDEIPSKYENCAPHVEKLREKNPGISDGKFSRQLLKALSSYPKERGFVQEISWMGMKVAMDSQDQLLFSGVRPVGIYCQFLFVLWGSGATITDEDPERGGAPSYAVFQLNDYLVRTPHALYAFEKAFNEARVLEWAEETKAVFGK